MSKFFLMGGVKGLVSDLSNHLNLCLFRRLWFGQVGWRKPLLIGPFGNVQLFIKCALKIFEAVSALAGLLRPSCRNVHSTNQFMVQRHKLEKRMLKVLEFERLRLFFQRAR